MKKGLTVLRGALVSGTALFLPLSAFAAGTTVRDVLVTIKELMDLGVPILITLAMLYFLYGLGEYIFKAVDAKSRDEARERMIGGIIALFVMASVWGLVGIVANTFGVQQGGDANLPDVPDIIGQDNQF